jgi:hypothetical protein
MQFQDTSIVGRSAEARGFEMREMGRVSCGAHDEVILFSPDRSQFLMF